MKPILKCLAIFASMAAAPPALAQGQFTAKVFLDGTDKPVLSTIEYEVSSGVWRSIKPTNGSGILSDQCPGTGKIRANPAALEFSLSDEKPCGGSINLPVDRRDVSDVLGPRWDWGGTGSISREDFAAAYAGAVLADLGRNHAEAAVPGGDLVGDYIESPRQLSSADKERAETIILNQTSSEFLRIDRDRDSLLSAVEIESALARPE